MTLITLHSRIHFASDVLEEALRAEIDENRLAHALVLCPEALACSEFLDRVEEGLASCPQVTLHLIAATDSKYDTARAAAQAEKEAPVDVIIAFGSAGSIARGRKCRHEITTLRYRALNARTRDRVRQKSLQPRFFVIPNIDGMPDPCLEAGPAMSFKTTPPGVIICDPTLIRDVQEADIAKATTLTIGRCLSVLSAKAFNPLADGLAIDALSRIRMMTQARGARAGEKHGYRDLMAATLNGAIALQKGTGLVEALGYSFGHAVGRDLDSALLHRVLLARILSSSEASDSTVIARVLGVGPETTLYDFVADLMADVPLPQTLQQLDIAWPEVEEAVGYMEPRFGTPQVASRSELDLILHDVY
ncbi:iron-containing alcohol dehydrogenase [uncultured Tateyamaria sp.]|uniref:iron-containing alcohol dehydrogenase n=1 Tax=uncultured Tateyamaria sp. TaxID=455651 RepID=UPI0026054168|nr:iron-containing alcohol dehydrogenase [uncultured Tateyamaria sp.]